MKSWIRAPALLAIATVTLSATADPPMHFTSGKWYDGSWWEVDVPKPWTVTETSNQHIRFANADASALIGLRKHARLHEISRRYPPPEPNLSPAQEAAYTSAKAEASMSWWPLPIPAPSFIGSVQRTDIGKFMGWTYTTGSDIGRKRWAGFLTQESWSLYVRLESPTSDLEANMSSFRSAVSTVRFGK